MAWTNDQLKAINISGRNILTSSGAGSGKTAVLTERVIEKVKHGISVSNLLILTFTHLAALEMKSRIRASLKKYPEYKEEVNKLDSCYITTFDSFSLSIVKKYHYVLNINRNISICHQSLISSFILKSIDEIFEEMYEENNDAFLNMIYSLCLKDDQLIKNFIFKTYIGKFSSLIDIEKYLMCELKKQDDEEYILLLKKQYEEMLKGKISELKKSVDEVIKFADPNFDSIETFKNILYDESIENINEAFDNFKSYFPNKNKNCDEEYSKVKEKLKKEVKDIRELLEYQTLSDFKNDLEKVKGTKNVIIEIFLKLNEKVKNYKRNNDLYDFSDIARLAIKLVSENESIKEELQKNFLEIMVDEYQDTSDIQEKLISLISNNNVYYVGDVKQSIYRFRNANPILFMNKYNTFKDSNSLYKDGESIKIDLKMNFRSRNSVIKAVNSIFSSIMTDSFGGANYEEEHKMEYGNKGYDALDNDSYDMEVLNYHGLSELDYEKVEKEAFIICKDIKEKIAQGFMVFDKETKSFRKIKYSDFAILISKSTDFNTFKKIFEYENIPLSLFKSESLLSGYNLIIIKNLLKFIIKTKNKEFDDEYKHLYASLSRSFLCEKTDGEVFSDLTENKIFASEIYNKALEIILNIDILNNVSVLACVINEFDLINKSFKSKQINKLLSDITSLSDLAQNLNNVNLYISDLVDLIDCILDNDLKLEYDVYMDTNSSVKLMTIHKSKGLEFPICYFPSLYSQFNNRDFKANFCFDNELGIIVPYFDKGIKKTFLNTLFVSSNQIQELSEKVRLFYVALTRAREKIIFLDDIDYDKDYSNTSINKAKSYREYLQSLYSKITFKITNVDTLENITQKYKFFRDKDLQVIKEEPIMTKRINVSKEILVNKHYSKEVDEVSFEKVKLMDLGTRMHEFLEYYDFENKDIELEDLNFMFKKIVSSPLFEKYIYTKKGKVSIYKEHEFMYNNYNGIIDLLLEYDDEYVIIDYKLSNIDDTSYDKQVRGYMDYVHSITNKNVKGFLYSLYKGTYREVK